MNRTIWKFPLRPSGDTQEVRMPVGAVILAVREQGEQGLAIWAMVDPIAATEVRRFMTVGTGYPFHPGETKYLGMAHLLGGGLVIHVFEDLMP